MKKTPMIILLTLLCTVFLVYASPSFISPLSSGVMQGTSYVLNISAPEDEDLKNCTVIITSSSGTATSTIVLRNNTLGSQTNYANATFVPPNYKDASDYTFSATCYNDSGDTDTVSATSVTVDTTDPICTWSQSSGLEYSPDQTFTVTCDNATSASLRFGSNSVLTMVESADVCTYTGNIPEGAYPTVVATVTDGYNSTICTLTNVQIDSESTVTTVAAAVSAAGAASAGAKFAAAQQQTSNRNNFLMVAGVLLLIIWYTYRNKK